MKMKNFGAKPFFMPQPVMIIGTYDKDGKANAMNAAWGGIVGPNELIVDLSPHQTTVNIQERKAFTVHIGDVAHVEACDYVGIVSAKKEPKKMEKAGFTTHKSEFVDAPVINELPFVLECKLIEVIGGSKYLAEIVNVAIDENILKEDGSLDMDKFRPITYDGITRNYYALGDFVAKAFSIGAKLK